MDVESPIGPEHQQELREAEVALRGFMGATKVASFHGWTIGVFAAVSLLAGLASPSNLLVGTALAVVARNEFKGRDALRNLDPQGPVLLWQNQLGFLGFILVYCLGAIFGPQPVPDPELAQLTEMLGEGVDELVRELTVAVYGTVIVAAAVVQGLTARYYKDRSLRLSAYLRDTPSWIVEVQRARTQ